MKNEGNINKVRARAEYFQQDIDLNGFDSEGWGDVLTDAINAGHWIDVAAIALVIAENSEN